MAVFFLVPETVIISINGLDLAWILFSGHLKSELFFLSFGQSFRFCLNSFSHIFLLAVHFLSRENTKIIKGTRRRQAHFRSLLRTFSLVSQDLDSLNDLARSISTLYVVGRLFQTCCHIHNIPKKVQRAFVFPLRREMVTQGLARKKDCEAKALSIVHRLVLSDSNDREWFRDAVRTSFLWG